VLSSGSVAAFLTLLLLLLLDDDELELLDDPAPTAPGVELRFLLGEPAPLFLLGEAPPSFCDFWEPAVQLFAHDFGTGVDDLLFFFADQPPVELRLAVDHVAFALFVLSFA